MMAAPSVTYTFTNLTVASATQVNQNFTDIINALTDGTKDLTVGLLQANDDATFNGDVTLGNATGDGISFTGRVSTDIDPTNAATNTLGDATQTWQALYLDNTTTDGGAVYFNASSTAFLKSTADGTELDLGGFTYFDLQAGVSIKTFGRYAEAKSADYTVSDTDGVSVVLMTTSTTDRTVTLPTASANTGRVVTVKKVDSGSGSVTLDGEGSETIDGSTTVEIGLQYGYLTVLCDGTSWHIIDGEESFKVALDTDFTGGNVIGTRQGRVVNILTDAAAWTNDNSVLSGAIIPSRFRPGKEILNVSGQESSRVIFTRVSIAGQLILDIRTSSDLNTAASATTDGTDVDTRDFSISYIVK